jgi:hypothetical protein
MKRPSINFGPGTSLEARLQAHPELRHKIEALLSIVENAQGDIVLADAAEARVIEELQQLGQAALQEWAKGAEAQQRKAYREATPNAYRSGKKSSTGTAGMDASKS